MNCLSPKRQKKAMPGCENQVSPIFLVALLYGSYPMSVMSSYCLIGNYPYGSPYCISIPYQNLFPYHLIHLQQTVTYDFAISFAHPHFHIITSHFCKRLPTILNKPDIKAKSNFMATYKILRNDNYFLR